MRRRLLGNRRRGGSYSGEWEEIIAFAQTNSISIPTGAEYDRLENICVELVNNEIWNELDVFAHFESSAPSEFRRICWIRKVLMTEVNSPVWTDTGVEANAAGTAYILTGYTPSIHAVKLGVNNVGIGFKSMTVWPTNNSGIVGGRTGNNASQIAYFNSIFRPMEPLGQSVPPAAGVWQQNLSPDGSLEVSLNGVSYAWIGGRTGSEICTVEQTILRTNGLYTAKPGTKLGAVYYGSKNIDPVKMNEILNL